MHHRFQSGMRENPASDRRHGSRQVVSSLADASHIEEETAASPPLERGQNYSPINFGSTANAAPRRAATGGDERSTTGSFVDAISGTPSKKFEDAFEPLITSLAATKLLGDIHVKTLQRYARRGNLPGYQIGGHWYFRASELDSWLRSRLNSTRHPCRLSKEAK
ncbi:MAG TPA: helix-turn-helix domain-containing protein [Candidatus Micrarchaeia archaeon]|nr:helix-turn-helix domain-containing protein [Candidatus Micrarchaeia archaeon]